MHARQCVSPGWWPPPGPVSPRCPSLLDHVHRGLLGRGAGTVDADVAAPHLGLLVLVGALVRVDQPAGPAVAHLSVVEELVLLARGVRVLLVVLERVVEGG